MLDLEFENTRLSHDSKTLLLACPGHAGQATHKQRPRFPIQLKDPPQSWVAKFQGQAAQLSSRFQTNKLSAACTLRGMAGKVCKHFLIATSASVVSAQEGVDCVTLSPDCSGRKEMSFERWLPPMP
ncbi:unnamed protein product [Polarella glacialis]|uniref:Uncharacterized protein n=1 Tax=Polarella glacialis TaxID=89957 RepID=A0A813J1H9_POLGL|nr:unnamed protein product [Polarella glacialis]CAE8677265.1 unnamed protein product [Polarella glacialis]